MIRGRAVRGYSLARRALGIRLRSWRFNGTLNFCNGLGWRRFARDAGAASGAAPPAPVVAARPDRPGRAVAVESVEAHCAKDALSRLDWYVLSHYSIARSDLPTLTPALSRPSARGCFLAPRVRWAVH